MTTLIAPTPQYLQDLQRHASDLRVSATCNVPHPYPQDGAARWMERTLKATSEKKKVVFMVLSDDAFCGLMSLNAIDWERSCAELDYWIAGDYQGLGIGTEAARLSAHMHNETKQYTNQSNTQSKPLLKIAIDAHLAWHVMAMQEEGSSPKPPQRFQPADLLKWIQQKIAGGWNVVTCYEARLRS